MMTIAAMSSSIRDNRRMIAIVAALTLIVAIVSLPMRLVLAAGPFDRGPFQAFSASGTVWDGRLNRLNVGPVGLGNMDASLRFWPLFIGRQSFSLDMEDAAGRATLTALAGGYEIADMTAALPLDNLLAPLPAGQLRLEDFGVRFARGKCLSASGRISLTLRPFLSDFDSGDELVGAPRCSDDRLLLPFANGAETRMVNIYIDAGGEYRATLWLQVPDSIDPLLMESRGLEREGGRWRMQLGGRL